ncbi:unnamed protein product [Symbiodinium microadriaticum]|nr:unnamed protein product [Symbiodinium microadriaticum]
MQSPQEVFSARRRFRSRSPLCGSLARETGKTSSAVHGASLSSVHYRAFVRILRLPVDAPCCRSNHYETACRWIHTGPGSSLRFKFFYHSILWEGDEVDELSSTAGVWIPVQVSRDYLLREPDSSLEEPLWVQYAHKAGGELAELAKEQGAELSRSAIGRRRPSMHLRFGLLP